MSKFTLEVVETKQVPVRFLTVDADVRYWEDGKVNGVADSDDDPKMPLAGKDGWKIVIDLDTGKIQGWPEGTTASVHYKVCDAGVYGLVDEGGNKIASIDGYVPAMLSPGGEGYGDYIIMNIGPDGTIADWRVDLSPFAPDGDG